MFQLNKFFLILLLTSFSISSFACAPCGAKPLSDKELAVSLVKQRIKDLKRGASREKQQKLDDIQAAVKSNINNGIDRYDVVCCPVPRRAEMPLIEAMKLGDQTLVGLLLEANANPNLPNDNEYLQPTPLISLAQMDHLPADVSTPMAQLLIGAKANVDAQNPANGTPLTIAMYNRQVGLVRTLIDARASLDVHVGKSKQTPVEIAMANKKQYRERFERQAKELEEVAEIQARELKKVAEQKAIKMREEELQQSPAEVEIYSIISEAWQKGGCKIYVPPHAADEQKV